MGARAWLLFQEGPPRLEALIRGEVLDRGRGIPQAWLCAMGGMGPQIFAASKTNRVKVSMGDPL